MQVVLELSPRMRGKRQMTLCWDCAKANYPRVCGENKSLQVFYPLHLRTIPAYAGKTLNKHLYIIVFRRLVMVFFWFSYKTYAVIIFQRSVCVIEAYFKPLLIVFS